MIIVEVVDSNLSYLGVPGVIVAKATNSLAPWPNEEEGVLSADYLPIIYLILFLSSGGVLN